MQGRCAAVYPVPRTMMAQCLTTRIATSSVGRTRRLSHWRRARALMKVEVMEITTSQALPIVKTRTWGRNICEPLETSWCKTSTTVKWVTWAAATMTVLSCRPVRDKSFFKWLLKTDRSSSWWRASRLRCDQFKSALLNTAAFNFH